MTENQDNQGSQLTLSRDRVLLSEEIPGGGMWSLTLRRHQALRLTDLEGGGSAALLLYNRDLLSERYNMPDTLKSQHTAFLTRGVALYSDMGRILCSITADTCGWHDTITGVSDAQLIASKYGALRYQEHRNGYLRNGRDCLINELSKWGLGARDLVPNINAFSKVVPDEAGVLSYCVGHSSPGSFIELRAEMNVLVVLSTCPHPLDPSPTYPRKPIGALVYKTEPPDEHDFCWRSRPENARGFLNTERFFLGVSR